MARPAVKASSPVPVENPKDVAGAKKTPLRFVPASIGPLTAKVFQDGAEKYGPFNWRDISIKRSAYIEAAERHLLALKDGEDFDPSSGEHHAAHIIAGLAIMLDADSLGRLIDDRFTSGDTSNILESTRHGRP